MGGRFVWLGSLGVWTVRWRSFVTLRIRRGVRIRVSARGDLWLASGGKCGNRGLWELLVFGASNGCFGSERVSATLRSGRNDGVGGDLGRPCAVVVLRAKCGGSSPSAQNDKQKQKAKADPLRG